MDEMAGGIRFNGDLEQFPCTAQTVGREREIGRVEMVLEVACIKPEPALIGALCANKALLCERRYRDACIGGPAWVEAFVPSPIFQEFETARPSRQRESLCHDELFLAEPHQSAGREGACKRTYESRRMESDLVKCAFGHSAESSGDLNAKHIGGEHLLAAGALAGADCEHRR